ncbi:PQQ-dependent sugar dehydrogenase [Sphingobium sp. CAP-1]|uniref:PQQ-dependent sugar dehydrogenase n=1 Tax=Sphingobium sp. CAP-1 TaxID=2676077 RepID=UPI0018AD1B2C|nr:PQQ-dependent sugar dehydrogenase [Sphingobium sp. CAP-1]
MKIAIAPVATFNTPWAINFLPDGRLLVTQAFDGLRVVQQNGQSSEPVTGLPQNLNAPFDVIASPKFAQDGLIYLSYSELEEGGIKLTPTTNPVGKMNLAVLTARLNTPKGAAPSLSDVKVIWRQTVQTDKLGEYSGKMAFSPDGTYLFITSGDRSLFYPGQDQTINLGKTIRLFADGTVPTDNANAGKPDLPQDVWTSGHRNAYGIAFDRYGKLWEHEMGPKGGDEFNLMEKGANYGWYAVSYGDNYDGGLIAKPAAGDGYHASAYWWMQAIAPAGLFFYSGRMFPTLYDHAILGGLQAKGLVIVKTSGDSAAEVDRIPLGARIRDVRQAPDGSIWAIEDAPTGRLLRLTPG